jgi:CDP-glucose 4,6-dehydratase
VFHLAAQTIVGTANRSPVSTFETNIRGTWTLLEACRLRGVGRVVVAASDKAYGAHDELPYREDCALQPRYPYDVSKAATDMIARSYWHTFELPVAVTRFANLYGGGDLNLSRLVPECALTAIEGRRPVIRSDGSLERDFLYVDDAVEAYLAIWALLGDGRGAGEAFNAGGDRPHSVLEVVELTCKIAGTGMEPDVRGAGAPPGEIVRQWVDSTKLRSLSGWSPRVSLEEGLSRTVDWLPPVLRTAPRIAKVTRGPRVARAGPRGAAMFPIWPTSSGFFWRRPLTDAVARFRQRLGTRSGWQPGCLRGRRVRPATSEVPAAGCVPARAGNKSCH